MCGEPYVPYLGEADAKALGRDGVCAHAAVSAKASQTAGKRTARLGKRAVTVSAGAYICMESCED